MGGVKSLAEQADDLPYKEETLRLLSEIIAENEAAGGEPDKSDGLERLKALHYGEPYYWLYRFVFPKVRRSSIIITYGRKVQPGPKADATADDIPRFTAVDTALAPMQASVMPKAEPPAKPFYLSLHTNMLLDAALIPNLGFDIYAGKGWSVHGNWHYGWWHDHPRHWWWRSYGGDLEVRRWFGGRKPLDGHHIGIYGQMLTYDFETGGRGYLAPKWSWGAGVSYGYSLPVTERLSIDFSVGFGYMGGKYYEYLPDRNCYVWQVTKQRHWYGPTKAEVSLVWQIGRGNINKSKARKGGRRR